MYDYLPLFGSMAIREVFKKNKLLQGMAPT